MADKTKPIVSNLEKDKYFYADDFNALKARVKAELARRSHYKDISQYSNANYDYEKTPEEDLRITIEHINKILEPMQHIHPKKIGFDDKVASDGTLLKFKPDEPIPNLNILLSYLAVCETDNVQWSYTSQEHCMANCEGLCHIGCYNRCKGCGSCGGCAQSASSDSSGGSSGVVCDPCTRSGNCGNSCTNGCVTGCLTTAQGCSCGTCASAAGSSSTTCDKVCSKSCKGNGYGGGT